MDNTNEIEMFSQEEMQSPFEAIKETDVEGREWWNSRKLARLMGYQKYWNFERLMDKVSSFLQQEKGLDLKEHMVEIEEMVQLNNGVWRGVPDRRLAQGKEPTGVDSGTDAIQCAKARPQRFARRYAAHRGACCGGTVFVAL